MYSRWVSENFTQTPEPITFFYDFLERFLFLVFTEFTRHITVKYLTKQSLSSDQPHNQRNNSLLMYLIATIKCRTTQISYHDCIVRYSNCLLYTSRCV